MEVQDIQRNYSLEFDRKDQLLRAIFNDSKSTSLICDRREFPDEKLFSELLSLWPDSNAFSFIDQERGKTMQLYASVFV